ncbi:MAG: carbohydrate ABC transporter permease [Steroidobacteraceae bacterium]
MTARGTARLPRSTILLATLAALLMLTPMLWVVILSFKDNTALMADSRSAFLPPWTFANYRSILGESQVFTWLLNSITVSLAMTAGVLVLSSLAGYGFARLQFPGRRVLFVIVLLGLAIPEQAVIIGRHQMFSAASLHNTYAALVLPGLSMPFGVFLMTQYFRAIPKEIDEAALLDGASRLRIFWRVLLPLSIPAQATLGIFTFFHAWNDYWWPLISATDKDMLTLTVGIAATQMNFAQTEGLGFLMAQAVFAGLPTLLVYLVFQKYIVRAVAGAAGQ